jgi:CHAT domain-containing protein
VEPLGLGKGVTRVLVAPDGEIAYVPFGALFHDRETVLVPSGTVLGILLEEGGKRGEGVLALGDPDYGKPAGRTTVASLRGNRERTPLPATRDEAKAVGTVVLLGKEATEGNLRAALGKRERWRAVHFACHGFVEVEKPVLSCLALTAGDKDDGDLTVLEIFRMRFPADLVVLSACETGRGRVVRGEGIMGLTRAFMFAGAPRVLVSLWKVEDRATRALMERFYERWNGGASPAAALREAQAFVAGHERWRHPKYWAAWVLWGLPE